jgi:hypothetical protein
MIAWVLGVGAFSYHYGNQPIFTGSNFPTATQTEPVEVKGTVKYVTVEDKRLFDVSDYLFFGTWWVGAGGGMVLIALRIYGPAAWRKRLEKIDKEHR